jgi:hypothetical protein
MFEDEPGMVIRILVYGVLALCCQHAGADPGRIALAVAAIALIGTSVGELLTVPNFSYP